MVDLIKGSEKKNGKRKTHAERELIVEREGRERERMALVNPARKHSSKFFFKDCFLLSFLFFFFIRTKRKKEMMSV